MLVRRIVCFSSELNVTALLMISAADCPDSSVNTSDVVLMRDMQTFGRMWVV